MSTDENLSKVMSGRTWEEFCDALKAAGQVILRPDAPATELDRAEGFRYLSRLTRASLEMNVECGDPDFPVFFQLSNATIKIGADNPDNHYLNAVVAGDREYRLRGTRGTVPFLSFATKANRYAIDGTMASTGELDSKDMRINPDGTFEIVVSRTKHPGNWLPMEADSTMLLVRNTFLDRPREIPASLTIERIGGPSKPKPLTADRIHRALLGSAAFVRGTAHTFAEWAKMFAAKPNTLETVDQTMFIRGGGDPVIFYLHGVWTVPKGQALVVELNPPECEIWNFHIDNWWMETLDYRYLPIHVNKHTAKYNADGSVTVVVAHEDRGFRNWLDPDGHEIGTMLLRWTRAKSHPIPKVRLVPISEAPRAT